MKTIKVKLTDKEYKILQLQIEWGEYNMNEFKTDFMNNYNQLIDTAPNDLKFLTEEGREHLKKYIEITKVS